MAYGLESYRLNFVASERLRIVCCVAGERLRTVMFLDHAAAKRADLSHQKTSCLKGWVAKNPRSEAITATVP